MGNSLKLGFASTNDLFSLRGAQYAINGRRINNRSRNRASFPLLLSCRNCFEAFALNASQSRLDLLTIETNRIQLKPIECQSGYVE